MGTSMIRIYSELMTLRTFEERYFYLRLGGKVGKDTFGFDRYLYQNFLHSQEWRRFRRDIIIRDQGRDLGIADREIPGLITIHHLNSISIEDVARRSDLLLDPENVICASDMTHKAIHYGDDSLLIKTPIERCANDTCPWRKN